MVSSALGVRLNPTFQERLILCRVQVLTIASSVRVDVSLEDWFVRVFQHPVSYSVRRTKAALRIGR